MRDMIRPLFILRPRRFSATIPAMNSTSNWNLIGHEWAVSLLAGRVAAGRVSHAHLITGARGLGKSLLARRLAQAMNCVGDSPPCGVCRPCEHIERNQHPDLITLEPDGATIKIEQIRDLQNGLTLRPNEARYRVAIILNADKMTAQSADALLKTLEEPPDTSRLILAADVADGLPQTIASRCQVMALRPVPIAQLEAELIARYGVPVDQAALLARLSGGRPGWAINAANHPEILALRGERLAAMLDALRANRSGRFAYSESVAAKSDALPELIDQWRSLWRDVLLLAEGSPVEIVNADLIDALRDVAYRAGREGARKALKAAHQTADLLDHTNANARLALDVMLLRMPYL